MSKQLDFSGLQQIAYKGFEDQPEERDSLLEAGYTIVEEPVPFTDQTAPSAQPSAPETSAAPCETTAGTRDHKGLYRMAFDFHKRHSPPVVNREYWKGKTPGIDDTPEEELRYWTETAEDAGKTSAAGGSDPFLIDLIIAIMNDLEREYKRLRESA